MFSLSEFLTFDFFFVWSIVNHSSPENDAVLMYYFWIERLFIFFGLQKDV